MPCREALLIPREMHRYETSPGARSRVEQRLKKAVAMTGQIQTETSSSVEMPPGFMHGPLQRVRGPSDADASAGFASAQSDATRMHRVDQRHCDSKVRHTSRNNAPESRSVVGFPGAELATGAALLICTCRRCCPPDRARGRNPAAVPPNQTCSRTPVESWLYA